MTNAQAPAIDLNEKKLQHEILEAERLIEKNRTILFLGQAVKQLSRESEGLKETIAQLEAEKKMEKQDVKDGSVVVGAETETVG